MKEFFEALKEYGPEEIKKYLRKTGVKLTEEFIRRVNAYLEKKYPEWGNFMEEALKKGLYWAKNRFLVMKNAIITWCNQNASQLLRFIQSAPVSCKESVAKTLSKQAGQKVASEVTKKATTKVVEKIAVETTKRAVIKGVVSAANPVGLVADVAQMGLELTGNKTAGKVVGATGQMASGAMTGFALGGPIGAGIGAAAGYGLWAGGEVVGNAVGWMFGATQSYDEIKG